MSDERKTASVLRELTDELRVQSWLAQSEILNPSQASSDADSGSDELGGKLTEEVHAEASALARMRDEIRVQLHLGKLEAEDEFHRVEDRWRTLMKNDVEPAANTVAENLEAAAHDLLREIRDRYETLLGHRNDASESS